MLGKTKHIHFVGIGGIGMSGIAEVLINLGFEVSGSDLNSTVVTKHLKSLGAKIYKGHKKENIGSCDIVVVSSAVSPSNLEVDEARKRGIPIIPRSDMLGELMTIREGIAIAGAHGKTTTTSIAAEVVSKAGLDPTIVVGGRVKGLKANAKLGQGKFIIAEVDESDGYFVRLSPVIALITNIDREHIDFYGGLENIYKAFITFAGRVPFYGVVICCSDNSHVRAIIPKIDRRIITFGLGDDADVQGVVKEQTAEGTKFSLLINGVLKGDLFINLPGRYNVLNALGVCALAEELGIDFKILKAGLAEFQGVGRRFEFKGEAQGILFLDDYAHHPTEIQSVIETTRKNFSRRIVVVFQPHRYTRTRDLYSEFDTCFNMADQVFITDVYPAGEDPLPGISGDLIYRVVLRSNAANVVYLPDRKSLKKAVSDLIKEGDLVLTLGAGDVWRLGEEILSEKGL
ncbi:UDP-N-acetylmuramate--L-alanine ligase [bacterium]|nr:UDP-N-acetylmuramate--L-alanine ligase [bacterium]